MDVESMKMSFTNIMAGIEERMAIFEAELQKSSKTNSTPSLTSLASDFTSFRSFVVDTITAFRRQMDLLAKEVDNMEMRSRRKMLLFHGIAEQKSEVTAQIVADVIQQSLEVPDFTVESIKRCHRIGRSSGTHKPRPILVKLDRVALRDKIWFSKTKLKGSGQTISEFLTKARHEVFMAARERVGVSKAWTKEGYIYVLDAHGSPQRISSCSDLGRLNLGTSKTPPAIKTVAPKTRRAVSTKK